MDLTCAMAEVAPSTPTLRDARSLAKSKTCSKHTGGPIRDGRIEGLSPQMNIPTTSTPSTSKYTDSLDSFRCHPYLSLPASPASRPLRRQYLVA